MGQFKYKGVDAKGKTVTGIIEAEDRIGAFNKLKKLRIEADANKITEYGKGMSMEIKIPGFGPKVKGKDVVIFTRQFATMVDAGLPLVKGLDIISGSAENPAFSKTLKNVKEQVEQGLTLAEAMAKEPRAFNELYTNMIRAGENGGILDIILERLSLQMEKSQKLAREVKTALIYQITSNDTILPLPAFVGRQVMYYENRLFKKALKLRTGFNVSFTTDYYGYEFMPGISQFYVQSKKKIGNYPYIDFFISLHLKRAQIFFKWEHLNAGMMSYDYLLTPTTPALDRSFKFGVSWNMFD